MKSDMIDRLHTENKRLGVVEVKSATIKSLYAILRTNQESIRHSSVTCLVQFVESGKFSNAKNLVIGAFSTARGSVRYKKVLINTFSSTQLKTPSYNIFRL